MRKQPRRQPPVPTFEKVEIDYVVVPNEEFEQLLDEWAEIVYQYLCNCQLSEKKSLAPETTTPFAAESTGTNG